jgi:hypothetical protein
MHCSTSLEPYTRHRPKSTVFRDSGTYRLYLPGRRVGLSQPKNQQKQVASWAQLLTGSTGENHEKLQSWLSVSRSRLQSTTFQIQVRSVAALTNMLGGCNSNMRTSNILHLRRKYEIWFPCACWEYSAFMQMMAHYKLLCSCSYPLQMELPPQTVVICSTLIHFPTDPLKNETGLNSVQKFSSHITVKIPCFHCKEQLVNVV